MKNTFKLYVWKDTRYSSENSDVTMFAFAESVEKAREQIYFSHYYNDKSINIECKLWQILQNVPTTFENIPCAFIVSPTRTELVLYGEEKKVQLPDGTTIMLDCFH